jgi:hypothetical protein
MNNSIELSLAFKGEREYIHGTDVINESIKQLKDLNKNITVQFHEMLYFPVVLVEIPFMELSNFKKLNDVSGSITYKTKHGDKKLLVLVQNNEKKISDRYEHDESIIIEGYVINDKTISQNYKNHGSFIERVVSLYKKLLNTIVSKEFWLFVRIDLSYYPSDMQNISIKLTNIVGGRMFKASISSNGTCLGTLIFLKGNV